MEPSNLVAITSASLLDSEKAADILEEMDPDEAADLLAELSDEASEDILDDMGVTEAREIEELLEYGERTAGGMMTKDFVTVAEAGTVLAAIEALRQDREVAESTNTNYTLDDEQRLTGAISVVRLYLSPPSTALSEIKPLRLIFAHLDAHEKDVIEMFDKYNLLSLPVIGEDYTLAGVITAGKVRDIISKIAGAGNEVVPAVVEAGPVFLLAVLGPGFITSSVDNEAGGILTYSQAAAQYGYLLLWTLIPMTVSLIVVQEMCARMGAVTGKGLSDLIREEFGFRTTFWLMVALVAANFMNIVAEFAGVAASLRIFGITPYISVPVAAILVWVLVVYGDYKSVE